ncbi:MAG: hypothetical protein GQ544_05700, partial [Candidatus Aminicenantes bacterium]|nr:hypothetical protein [Candidatus Aminicenantes bacterium]
FLVDFLTSHVLDEKIFVVPSYQVGHQIGEGMAAEGHSWANLRFMSLPLLANDIAGIELSKRKLKQISRSASLFLVETIFRDAMEEGKLKYFGEFEVTSGLMRALLRSIEAVRMAGLSGLDLDASKFISADKGNEVILLLRRYEEELEKRGLVDLAGLYSLALEVLESKEGSPERLYLCLQDMALGGLGRKLLEKAAGDRLVGVPQGPVYGWERPRRLFEIASPPTEARNDKWAEARNDSDTESRNDKEKEDRPHLLSWVFDPGAVPADLQGQDIKSQDIKSQDMKGQDIKGQNSEISQPIEMFQATEIFQAIGPTNECREILRRIILEKISFDEVEIIHPAGSVYPSLFYVLSSKAGLKVTYGGGIPLGFTSPGRVFHGFVSWIEWDFQAMDLCNLLEGNALRLSASKDENRPSPMKVSRYLKNAMIGWGRERYLPRLKSLRQGIEQKLKSRSKENGEDIKTEHYEKAIHEIKWVERFIRQLLEYVPQVDDQGLLNLGLWCEGLGNLIRKHSRIASELDREAVSTLVGRLNEVSMVATTKVTREEAFDWLRSLAEGISVGASGPMPGHIHLSSFRSGGTSGRKVNFLVGLDQGAFPGMGRQDPILLDEEREALSEELPTSSDALREKIYGMGSLLANLRGRVIFSYSSYDIIEERQSFPSSLLLQVYRLKERDPGLDYSALLSSLPEPSGYLPEDWSKVFDEIDWWLSRLSRGGALLDGREAIRRNFPDLNRGIEAVTSRVADLLTCFDGQVEVDEEEFNPVFNRDIVMSASRMELLAKCPFSYFLQYVLGVRKPDELEYDQSRWLDAMQRGGLLHSIFCDFMQKLREKDEVVSVKRHGPLMNKIAEDILAQTKEEIPPPSEGIYAKEKQELMETLMIFLKAEEGREVPVRPFLFEASFGMKIEEGDGIEDPAIIEIDRDHSFQLRGKIDRIDHFRENHYRVVDYKTGGYSYYEKLECFGRGKILQHVLYSIAAEQIIEKLDLDVGPHVVQSGYYFPTRKGEGKEILVDHFDRSRLKTLLLELLGILSEGNFLVNPDASCIYCDFQPVCPGEAAKKAKAKMEANPHEFGVFERLKEYD